MRRCGRDGTYTLADCCPACGGRTALAHPPRFSPEDRYGRYRRMVS